jgi:hypothetical protein
VQESTVKPGEGSCSCGRELVDADVHVYRSHTVRCVFHRCECGAEWTEYQADIDPSDPVSSDEVLEVHMRLASFDGSISELLRQLSV